MIRVNCVAILAVILSSVAYADEGSFTNSGGSTSASASGGVSIVNSTVASPAGAVSLVCPETSATLCSGGNFSFSGSGTTITAKFTSGKFVESCYDVEIREAGRTQFAEKVYVVAGKPLHLHPEL